MSVRLHTRLEGHVQHAINKHRRSLLVELAREDLRKAMSSLPEKDAEVYRAALRRELDEAEPVRVRAPSVREVADRLFKFGAAA